MNNERASSNGIGCGTVLFMIFLVLKLTHNIDWSWWLVTAPLWAPLAVVALIAIAVGVAALGRRS